MRKQPVAPLFRGVVSAIRAILLLLTGAVVSDMCRHSYRGGGNTWFTRQNIQRGSPANGLGAQNPFGSKSHSSFSRVACVGVASDSIETACSYHNICYQRSSKKIIFYAPGQVGTSLPATLPTKPVQISSQGDRAFLPDVKFEPVPSFTEVARLHTVHVLWHHWASMNLGHLIWEDFAGIWTSLIMFGDYPGSTNFTVLTKDFECHAHCLRISNEILGALGGKVQGPAELYFEAEAISRNVQHVCFDLVGGALTRAFVGSEVPSRHFGRETLLYSLRDHLLLQIGVDPRHPARSHHIVITNKTNSEFTNSAANAHRAIVNVAEISQTLRQQYPLVKISVVEWHTLSFKENLLLLSTVTILITPCGGVSTLLPFLPVGSHALVMDYLNTDAHSPFGGNVGDSMHMEGMLWDHLWHIRVDYYTVHNSSDFAFDFPGATDTRNDASIVVKPDRIKAMVSWYCQKSDMEWLLDVYILCVHTGGCCIC